MQGRKAKPTDSGNNTVWDKAGERLTRGVSDRPKAYINQHARITELRLATAQGVGRKIGPLCFFALMDDKKIC